MTDVAPKRTGKAEESVTLTGKLMPWDGFQPVLLAMPASDYRYLPLFDTEEALRALMERLGIVFDRIKQVEEGAEFLSSFEGTDVVVILNPWFTPEGKVRFTQVLGQQIEA